MIMSTCLHGSVTSYLVDYCTSISLVPGRSALRSCSCWVLTLVPSHQTDWGMKSFVVFSPSCWNVLPVDLRFSFFSLDTFANYFFLDQFDLAYSRQATHFWVCITFCRVRHGDSHHSPDQIIFIIITNITFTRYHSARNRRNSICRL